MKQIDYLRKSRKNCSALLMACALTFMLLTTTLSFAQTNSLTLGCPTRSGSGYSFTSLTLSTSTSVRGVTISFSENPAGCSISATTPSDWNLSSTSNDYVKSYTLPTNVTSDAIQNFLRNIVFSVPSNTLKNVQILLQTDDGSSERQVIYYSGNRHYYEYVAEAISWTNAYNEAKEMIYCGRKGYLATLTSAGEDQFVSRLVQNAMWLGGTRLTNTGSEDSQYFRGFSTTSNAGYWYWACGPEKGDTIINATTAERNNNNDYDYTMSWYANQNAQYGYTNWAYARRISDNRLHAAEPNNSNGESCLTILKLPVSDNASGTRVTRSSQHAIVEDDRFFGWNDVAQGGGSYGQWRPQGYLVEYGDLPIGDSGEGSESACAILATGMVGSAEITRSATISGNSTICAGETATLTLSFDSEFPPYSGKIVDLNGHIIKPFSTDENPYTFTVTPNETTTYTVSEFTDASSTTGSDGCPDVYNIIYEKLDSATVTVNTPQVALNNIAPVAICAGASTTLTATTGTATGEVSYAWSTGATGSEITVTPSETTIYTVTATATQGVCAATATKSVTVTVNELPTATISVTDVKCKGAGDGIITVNANGGSGSYQYQLGTGVFQGSSVFTGLNAGTYTITVTDANGCTTTASTTVSQPSALTVSLESENETCAGNDGSVALTVSGGTTPYSYAWSNGDTTKNLSSVPAGTYTVTVSDAKGCTNVQNDTITLDNPLAMDPITGPAVCTGTEFSITPQNGTNGTIPAGTTYSWPAPDAISGIGGLEAGTNENRIHGVLTNINNTPQTVSYVVTPKNGVCVGNAVGVSVTVTTTVNPNVTINMPNAMTVCSNAEIFNLSATFVNSVSNSTVVWKKDGTTMETHTVTDSTDSYAIDLANDTCKGEYKYRVEYTDVSGCTASDECVITVNAGDWSISQLAGTATVECVSAATEPDESLLPIVNDGCGRTTTRTFLSRESNPTEITCAGTVTYTYRYTACDDTYKDWTYTYTINDVTKPTIAADAITTKAANIDQTACKFSIPDLTADIRAKASDNCTADLVITQNPAAGTVITAATNVVVTVTDKCGNSTTHTVNVTVPTLPTATIAPTHILCHGNTTGSATVTPINGTAPYTYLWSNSQTVATATELDNIEYTVTVTDANGCTTTASVTITEPALLQITSITPTNITCPSGNDGKIEVAVTGGTTPYSYQMNGGDAQSSAIFETLTAGNYTVTVTDANGCSTTSSTTLTQPDPLALTGCPTNITENTDAGKSYATVTWTEPTFSPMGNGATLNVTGKTATNQYSVGTTTITYTVTNTCGESQSCSFTITVSDNQAPVITCAVNGNQDVLPNSAGNTYTHSGNSWNAIATDNVAVVSLTYTLNGATVDNTPKTTLDGQVFNYGTTTVTWKATDNTGASDVCSFQVVVADNTKPELACPTIDTVYECLAEVPEIYADYAAFKAAGGIATDNHQINESSLTVTETVVTGCPTTITRTYSIKDMTGNEGTCTQVITVEDKTAPALTGTWPANITGQNNCFANRNISGLLSNDAVKALYTDNCGGELTVDSSDVVTGDDCGWTVTRTYAIKDSCGNTVMPKPTMSVSGSDQTAPVLAGTWPANITGQDNCFANAVTSGLYTDDQVKALYSDCSTITVTHTDANTSTDNCGWTITRTYTIKDACNNTVTPAPTMSVSGSDQTAPALNGTWPDNITGQDNCFANAVTSGLYTDDQVKALYSDCSTITVTHTDANTLTSDCGWTITRTYTIKDACNNTVTPAPTMSVSGKDETAPALTGTWPANITGQNNCFANAVTSGLYTDDQVKALYSDCSTITVTHTDANTLTDDCGWTITRTYTIKDACNNTVTKTMSVSGSDQTAPALNGTWPDNITGQDNCFANADISGLLSDNDVKALYSDCSTITVTHTDANTLTSDCGWTITRTYTIKDACNNTVTPAPTMSVSGKDETAPALTGTWLANITGQNNCFANAVTSGLYTDDQVKALYSDCSTITVTHTDANTLTDDCGWTITRTYTIKDACNNTVTKTMSVSGKDQTAPALTGTWPSNITGQDNCFANAVTSGLYTDDQVKALYSDCSTITVTHTDANTLTDDCGWTITRTYTIKDACNNSVTKTMSVSGSDQTAPALNGTWPANITNQDNCFANADISELLSNDDVKALYSDCSTITVTHEDANTLTDNCGWTITRTYTIKDACGNTVIPKPTMSVSGSDQTAPALNGTWPANITNQDNCFANADISGLLSDNDVKALYSDCSTITVTHTDANTLTDDCGWTITRAYTIKDACGNTVTPAPAMSVSGSDQTAPALADTWPSDITGKNSCLANADTTVLKDDSEIKALYSDCSTITVTHTDTIEGNACDWTVTRTYTIKDSCGNTVSPAPTMSVSGSDQTAPAIGTDDLDRTLTSTNCVFKIPDMRDEVRNISTDCSEITVTQPSAGMVVYPMAEERDTTVNVIVTDSCGNSSVKEVVITIPAKVTISATATPAVICNGGTSQLSATPANVVGTAVYAWAPATELSSATIANPTVTLTASGAAATTTYTVQVTDDNGCTATATASVTVNPEVVMNSVTDWTLCVGETSPEYVYTSTITDGTVTYGWSNDNSAIGLAASGTGNLPSFVAANATSADLIAEVKVAPTYTNNDINCQGDSLTFHITVRPSIKTPGNVTFACPADTTVVLSYSDCEQLVNIGEPEFVNHMSGMTVNITNDAPAGNIFPEGTTVVTWTATDECGDTLTCTQNVVIQFPPCGDTIADFDGYRYSSVRIGCQCWTGENARSEHYSDGTPVDNFRYYNDSDSLENIYGKLYTWYTAVRVPEGDNNAEPSISTDPFGTTYVQGICPEGWALPTVNEYMQMIANSGDATHAKDGSNLYWLPGYEGQPPFSGFDAYGAGKYNGAIDRYQELLGKTYFWTTLSGSGSETATTVEINYYCAEGLQTELSKGDGVSIRCIRKR